MLVESLVHLQDGNVDHREFSSFMRQLDVQISKRQLSKLIAIVDPTGKGRVAKAALMYWLFPEEHLRLSMSVGQKIGMTLSQGSFTKLEGSQ